MQLQMELVCVKMILFFFPSTSLKVLGEARVEHLKNDPRKLSKHRRSSDFPLVSLVQFKIRLVY